MSGTETRRRERQVGVRLLPDEAARLLADAETTGESAGELLRRAYFRTASLEDVARCLYRMNGPALYGRDLGNWNDPRSDIGGNDFERDRWRRQAAYLGVAGGAGARRGAAVVAVSEHEPRWYGTGYGGGRMVCRCGDDCEDGYNAHAEVVHEAQIRDLLEEREELLTEIRRLRMGNHPAGRALAIEGQRLASQREDLIAQGVNPADLEVPIAPCAEDRDAGHDGGGGA